MTYLGLVLLLFVMLWFEIEADRRLEAGLETSLCEADLDNEDAGLEDSGYVEVEPPPPYQPFNLR